MTADSGGRAVRIPYARVLLVWAVLAAFLLVGGMTGIAARQFHDPDDVLRLVQVRDLLGGQGWFDLHQYRINPPQGTLMHWSRLVDAPLAIIIAMLTPVLGVHSAEQVAIVAVPLLTLAAIVLVIARMAARVLDGVEGVTLACLCIAASPLLMTQIAPLRIDHHGWQIFAVALALSGLLPGKPVPGAAVSGAALALGLSISLEVLPVTAAFGVIFTLRWLVDDKARYALVAFLGTLAVALALLFVATRGPADLAAHCDAISPPHLAFFALAALGTGGVAVLRPRSRPVLVGLLGLTAAGATGLYLWMAPSCAAGPFGGLDPLVREFWYDNVREGRPAWEVRHDLWMPFAAQGAVAIAVLAYLWRKSGGYLRRWWFEYLLVTAVTFVTGMLVWRSMAFVGALSAIPLGWLATQLLRALHEAAGTGRKFGIAALMLVILVPTFPVIAAKGAAAKLGMPAKGLAPVNATLACNISVSSLDRLESSTVFAPLDLGPALLDVTRHRVVATAHHRAEAGIHDVITGFIGTPEEARKIIRKHDAGLVLICTDLTEVKLYVARAPGGFAAELAAGRVPAWLEPVPVEGAPALKAWRVVG